MGCQLCDDLVVASLIDLSCALIWIKNRCNQIVHDSILRGWANW